MVNVSLGATSLPVVSMSKDMVMTWMPTVGAVVSLSSRASEMLLTTPTEAAKVGAIAMNAASRPATISPTTSGKRRPILRGCT